MWWSNKQIAKSSRSQVILSLYFCTKNNLALSEISRSFHFPQPWLKTNHKIQDWFNSQTQEPQDEPQSAPQVEWSFVAVYSRKSTRRGPDWEPSLYVSEGRTSEPTTCRYCTNVLYSTWWFCGGINTFDSILLNFKIRISIFFLVLFSQMLDTRGESDLVLKR